MNFGLEFKYKFEAAHRFTKSCSFSCATPHGHTWYATAKLASVDRTLGPDDMVMEFAKLKKNWKKLIDEIFDHSYLANSLDPVLPTLRQEIPHIRVVEFPCDPTTEIIAELLAMKWQVWLGADGLAGTVYLKELLIEETPTNSVSVQLAFTETVKDRFPYINGWWKKYAPEERGLC